MPSWVRIPRRDPSEDFHCKLRFTDGGPFLEIVNDDGSTAAVVAFIYDELKQWVTIAASALGALLKSKAGGGAKVPAPATPAETESPATASRVPEPLSTGQARCDVH